MDFVIHNGVLKKYTGKGKDIIIPEGVKQIADGFAKNILPKTIMMNIFLIAG